MKKLVSIIFLLTVALGFSQPTSMPTTPPVRTSSNVLSIFSGAYTNQTGVFYDNFAASTINADLSLTGSPAGTTKSYSGHSYSGIKVNTAGVLNVSGMTHLHLDVYSTNYNSLAVKLESSTGAAIELAVTGSIVPSSTTRNQWISLDLALSTYNNGNILTSLKYIVPVTYGQNATLYITNVYFYKPEATLSAPVLTTTPATAITNTTATINGNISSNGGPNITSYGFYWSTTNGFANGTGTPVVVGTTNTTGNITSNLTGLTTSTIYYYRAYATNSIGTTYGAQQSFTAITATSMQAAPIPPCRASSDVVAFYNEGPYTSFPTTLIWGGGISEVLIGSNKIELITNQNYAQIAFSTTTAAAAMTFLHVDIYSTTANASQVMLYVNAQTGYYPTPNGVWTSLDIPVSSLGGFASVNIVKILLGGLGTFYVDNIYFWRDPTTPTFTQVPAVCSGATITALPTTSNNGINGTWSPALNNTATTLYTFTTSGTCPNTTTMTITVNPTPTTTPVYHN